MGERIVDRQARAIRSSIKDHFVSWSDIHGRSNGECSECWYYSDHFCKMSRFTCRPESRACPNKKAKKE